MVGLLGRRNPAREPGDSHSKDSREGSEAFVEVSEDSQSSVGEKRKEPTKKRGNWLLGGLLNRSKSNENEEENHTGNFQHNDDDESIHSHYGSKEGDGDGDGDDSKQEGTSVANSAKVVETFPDSENEFHDVIRDQNWDLLDILLKEYDFKKYVKPKQPTKPPRKLRVAKYLPDIHWRKEVQVPPSPLYGLDALGRSPLHLCCGNACPEKPLLRLLFCARDLAAVPDVTGSLPIHLAVTHDKSVEVVDRLIRGYYQGAVKIDATGRTPLMWATEIIRRQDDQQQDDRMAKTPASCWAYPTTKEADAWQAKQGEKWKLVKFMLENRIGRRQKLMPREFRQVVKAMSLSAPPSVVSLCLNLGKGAMKMDVIAGPALTLCITRQYPLDLLEKVVTSSPKDFAKEHRDHTGRGVVASHYRIGCIAHQVDPLDENSKRQSFRMTMQGLANAVGDLEEKVAPSKEYLEWWGKLKYLINLWGTYMFEDDASYEDFDEDDLLLHNALSNPDVPPSLIRLLTSLRPHTTDLEHPKSTALPIHLACRVWRFKHFPPRRGEKESQLDKVVKQLLEGDVTRTRKRYRDRLPIHHAVAAGKNWQFVKPLVVHDRKSLLVRDPSTKLYPFQVAALPRMTGDTEALARHSFTSAEWNKMNKKDQYRQISLVETYYDQEQLELVFELLKQSPHAINHALILQEEAIRSATRPKRKIVMEGLGATDEVALAAQMRMIRGLFGLGNVASHFIAWAYENTRRGWKTHRSNFGVLKEAIMDGLIPMAMDKWWRTLKFWIWQDCPWQTPPIPRRDDFLLHGALCNPDVSPWIVDLLLECFPRSASIPLPSSDGCYPLHIACVTDRYAPLHFEFANKKTIIEMTFRAYPDAALLKWKTRLPLHLAIVHSKEWEEIQYLADEEPLSLSVPDPQIGVFPFQLMALDRPYTTKQRSRFEMIAQIGVGKEEWRALSAHDKVTRMSHVLEHHEIGAIGAIWELLKRNPVLVAVPYADNESSGSRSLSSLDEAFIMAKTGNMSSGNMSSSRSGWLKNATRSLSLASLDFLENIFEEDNLKSIRKKNRENSKSFMSSSDGSISDPFLGSSFSMPSDSSLEHRSVPSLSRHEEEFEYVEYIIEDSNTEHGEYEEVIPVLLDQTSSVAKATTGNQILPKAAENRISLELGIYDHEKLCHPRQKDIIFIRKVSAFIIWKNKTITPGTLKNSSRRSYWAQVLQQMGEPIDLGDVHKIRHERDQTFLASIVVDGVTIFIDEDDSFVWLLCGEGACSAAENYDIETATIISSPHIDIETGVWLDEIRAARQREALSGSDNSHRILGWILGNMETARPGSGSKRFIITRKMLRSAFANGEVNNSAEQIIENSTRRLWLDVAKQKMEVKIKNRKFIGVRFFIARRAVFQRQRFKFNESQKGIKFIKRLKKKQRHACSRARIKNESNSGMLLIEPRGHIDVLEQPNTHNNLSILEPPKPAPPEKPMLAAALKAKEQRDMSQYETSKNAIDILNTVNQPKPIPEDENASLGSTELFDEPCGPRPDKPLVAAALKAKKEADGRSGRHLLRMHQPSAKIENNNNADDASLAFDDLFDQTPGPPPEKPLLAAALKAKQQAENAKVLEESLHESPNQLQTTRRRAKRSQTRLPPHLRGMHQPKTIVDDDNASLSTSDVFDPPRGPPPHKPLLAAARKAKKQQEQQQSPSFGVRNGNSSVPTHLQRVHQPTTSYEEDDNVSLKLANVFDPPKPPPPEKPLLAAAQRAKEALDNRIYGDPPNANANAISNIEPPKVSEGSMTMGEIYISTPKRIIGTARKEGSEARKPLPLTAKMIRMNSVEQFQQNDDSIPPNIQATSPELPAAAAATTGKKTKQGLEKKHSRRGSASRMNSKLEENAPKDRIMRRKSGGIMGLLGKRAGQTS